MPRSRHRAGWVMVEPDVWLENGVVEIANDRITAVERSRAGDDAVDHGPGVILPALINAHAHLSLSALAGKIDTSRGFMSWVKDLIGYALNCRTSRSCMRQSPALFPPKTLELGPWLR